MRSPMGVGIIDDQGMGVSFMPLKVRMIWGQIVMCMFHIVCRVGGPKPQCSENACKRHRS